MTRAKQHRKPTQAPKRRARGFQRASDATRGTVKNVAGERGIAEADILMRWAEIVGADLCNRCTPVKVSYPAKRSFGASLIVQTDSGRAPEIEHLGPVIVDRVNRYYGYRAIGRLKVTQSTGLAPARGFAEDAARFAQQATGPTDKDRATAAKMADDIGSPGLRAALTQMGANVLARARSDPKTKQSE